MKVNSNDFAIGQSFLNRLSNLAITGLKIDKSFTKNIGEFNNNTVIKAILSMGRALGIDVIAEGIETEEQLSFLLAEGCKKGQGFLFSQPVDIKHADKFILENV